MSRLRLIFRWAVAVVVVAGVAAAIWRAEWFVRKVEGRRYRIAVHDFGMRYCFKCHGDTKTEANVRLNLTWNRTDIQRQARLWSRALDAVLTGKMPPKDSRDLDPKERDRFIAYVRTALDALDTPVGLRDPGPDNVRRLTRFEYSNTVHDLFGVDFDAAKRLPADAGGGAGFDNNSSTLFVPPMLLERYVAAAEEVAASVTPDHLLVAGTVPGMAPKTAATRIAEHFMPLVFRRPVAGTELDAYVTLHQRAMKEGALFEEAVRVMLGGMLVSPSFIFRVEMPRDSDADYRVNDFELASRLSYFIWSSVPDRTLFELAAMRSLHFPGVLREQVARMLRDPRADRLARNFTAQWLRLEKLHLEVHPDPRKFPTFTPALREAMYEEPIAFVKDLLHGNGSILALVDAPYTFVNANLAAHYELSSHGGDGFQKVPLPDRRRGGVLGMAGVLTLTSQPMRTSPVGRGKWILDELLAKSPPPPPPNVPSLPRDDPPPEGMSLRQRLERHRDDKNCAPCHAKIDPLGFALESFDPIGRWRTDINGKPVDDNGTMTDGSDFTGPIGLKDLLLLDKQVFVRAFSERMMGYALGRAVESCDYTAVNTITAALDRDGYRMQTLITEIAMSYPFQYRWGRFNWEMAK